MLFLQLGMNRVKKMGMILLVSRHTVFDFQRLSLWFQEIQSLVSRDTILVLRYSDWFQEAQSLVSRDTLTGFSRRTDAELSTVDVRKRKDILEYISSITQVGQSTPAITWLRNKINNHRDQRYSRTQRCR